MKPKVLTVRVYRGALERFNVRGSELAGMSEDEISRIWTGSPFRPRSARRPNLPPGQRRRGDRGAHPSRQTTERLRSAGGPFVPLLSPKMSPLTEV